MVLAGALRARRTGKRVLIPPPRLLIIQITTVGNEATVNETIRRIRGYQLDIPYRYGSRPSQGEANYRGRTNSSWFPRTSSVRRRTRHGPSIHTAPEGRTTTERLLRQGLFLDDDCVPTKSYIEKVFRADYDVCEGIPAPEPGMADSCRTWMIFGRSTASTCALSSRDGSSHPCARRGALRQRDGRGARDLGLRDVRLRGSGLRTHGRLDLTWGFVWDFVEMTSPFTWGDFLMQRRHRSGATSTPSGASCRFIEPPLCRSVRLRCVHLRRFHDGSCSPSRALPVRSDILLWVIASVPLVLDVRTQRGGQLGGRSLARHPEGAGCGRGRPARIRDIGGRDRCPGRFALFEGNPHRFEVIQKVDPKGRRKRAW